MMARVVVAAVQFGEESKQLREGRDGAWVRTEMVLYLGFANLNFYLDAKIWKFRQNLESVKTFGDEYIIIVTNC